MSNKKGQSGPGSHKTITSAEVEKLIDQIQAVSNCRVVIDEWGAIKEIHILANDSRNPKVIVRDVESALAARFGIMIDHKRISIAQVVEEDQAPRADRLALLEISLHRNVVRQQLMVEVRLCDLDRVDNFTEIQEYRGRSEGIDTDGQLEQLTVEAVVQAINPLLKEGYYLLVEAVGRCQLGQHQIINTLLYLHQPDGGIWITGSALLKEDLSMSAARSCLSAINRRLSILRKAKHSSKKNTTKTHAMTDENTSQHDLDEVAPAADAAPEDRENPSE